jgi:hypothetical protein
MCDPVTIGIALTVASTAVGAYGQIQQGQAINAQSKYEAKVADRNAKLSEAGREDARKRGEREQLNHWRRVSQMMGEQRAQFAAGGLDVNFGTPGAVVEDTMLIGLEDSQILAENTRKEMEGFDIEAANLRDSAKAARMRGKAAKQAGYIGAASTILGGAAQVAGKFSPSGSTGGGGGSSSFGSTSGYSFNTSVGGRGR